MALHVLTSSSISTIEVAEFNATVLAGPAAFTDTGLGLDVELAMGGAARKTCSSCGIYLRTIGTKPAFLTDASSTHTETMV